MCGIFGYIGGERASDKIYSGLEKLEYRGYDSSGVVVFDKETEQLTHAHYLCAPSKVEHRHALPDSNCAIGHTRWATHGSVKLENCHPHRSCDDSVFLVHNGVIENADEIKQGLENQDCLFYSETDTEALVNLISFYYNDSSEKDPLYAINRALKEVEGTYGLAIVFKGLPDTIFVVKRSSPLIIGLNKDESYVSSDITALPIDVEKVVYLEDGDVARVTKGAFKVYDANNNQFDNRRTAIKVKIPKRDKNKGDFSTFLEKEIFEQPSSIRESIRGRFDQDYESVVLGGINTDKDIKRVLFIGCGSAYNAGLTGKYFMEKVAKIPASVEISSEYKYKNNPTEDGTLVVALSQSGETADTLAALKEAQDSGLDTIAITNTVMSSIARQVDEGIYQRVGPEVSVASTKAFTSQLTLGLMLSILIGRKNTLSVLESKRMISYLRRLPSLIDETLSLCKQQCHKLGVHYSMIKEMTFLGRQYMYPIALEAALKVRELSYINTIGYASGEMKHGPLASIGNLSRCVFLAPQECLKDKNITSMRELKSRGADITLIKQKHQKFPDDCYDTAVNISKAPEYLLPILATIPMQLLGLNMAQSRNLNVDQPRNLAKSVTVE